MTEFVIGPAHALATAVIIHRRRSRRIERERSTSSRSAGRARAAAAAAHPSIINVQIDRGGHHIYHQSSVRSKRPGLRARPHIQYRSSSTSCRWEQKSPPPPPTIDVQLAPAEVRLLYGTSQLIYPTHPCQFLISLPSRLLGHVYMASNCVLD